MSTATARMLDSLRGLSPDSRDAVLALERRNGMLLAEDVLEAARDPESPLHPYFQWDDSAAAEAYRLSQASELIRRVKIEVVTQETTIRCVKYVNIPNGRPSAYFSLAKMRQDQGAALLTDELRRVVGNLLRTIRIVQSRSDAMPDGVLAELSASHRRLRSLLKRVQSAN